MPLIKKYVFLMTVVEAVLCAYSAHIFNSHLNSNAISKSVLINIEPKKVEDLGLVTEVCTSVFHNCKSLNAAERGMQLFKFIYISFIEA